LESENIPTSEHPVNHEMQARANNDLSAAVQRGIAMALLTNLQAGAFIMDVEGVPLSVAARVLLHPERCRATDWHH
jgi:hypothetical protein